MPERAVQSVGDSWRGSGELPAGTGVRGTDRGWPRAPPCFIQLSFACVSLFKEVSFFFFFFFCGGLYVLKHESQNTSSGESGGK